MHLGIEGSARQSNQWNGLVWFSIILLHICAGHEILTKLECNASLSSPRLVHTFEIKVLIDHSEFVGIPYV